MAVDATLKDRLYARFMSETSLPERACRDIARMAVEEFEGVEPAAASSPREVSIAHDERPETVASKFAAVLKAMGVAVADVSEEDGVTLEYRIGGKPEAEPAVPAEA